MAKARRPRHQITIDVDRTQCKACGICVALCSREVFDRDHLGYPVVARPEACTACMLCDWHCPDMAIEVTRHRAVSNAAEGVDARGQSAEETAYAHGQESDEAPEEGGPGDRVTAAVKTSHKLSGTRRELPPDAEPRGTKES